MADREAKIKIGVEGADEAIASAGRVKGAFEGAGKGIGASFGKLGGIIGGAVSGMISDLTRVANVAQGLNFVRAVESARQYQEAVGRMSISAGAKVSDLRQSFEYLSKKSLVPEKDIAGFVSSIQKVTHDSQSAAQSFVGLSAAAIETGKTADDMAPLYSTLHNVFGVTGDVTGVLEKMKGQAEALGTVGGPAVLHDSFVGVSGTLTQLSLKTDESRNKILGLLAVLQGSSNDPGHGQRAFQGLAGNIASRSVEYRHWLGMSTKDFYDDEGKVKVAALAKMQKKFFKTYGHGNFAYDTAVNTFGPEGAAEIFRHDLGKDVNAPSKPLTGLNTFAQSDSGKRIAAQNEAQRNARKSVEDKLPLLDKANDFISKHPLGAGLAISAGGGVISSLAGNLIKGGLSSLGGLFGGGTAAAGVGAEVAGGAGAAATGVGAAGIGAAILPLLLTAVGALGTAYLVDKGHASGMKSDDEAAFQEDEKKRARRRLAKISSQPISLPDDRTPQEMAADKATAGLVGRGASQELAVQTTANLLADAVNRRPLQITVINQTNGPIEVIDDQKNQSSAKQ